MIRKATLQDFEKILPLFTQFNNSAGLERDDWLLLFQDPFHAKQDHCGYVAEDNGEIIGFLGCIFSKRIINNQEHLFCNMSTWVVKESHRGMSLQLLIKVLQNKNAVITNFTGNKVRKILEKFGFQPIDTSLSALFPNPIGMFGKIKTETRPNKIEPLLDQDELKILKDHQKYQCSHMLLSSPDDHCYIIYDIVKKKRLPAARIHYISNPSFFEKHIDSITWHFCTKSGTFAMLLGDHFQINFRTPLKTTFPQKLAVVFRSNQLTPADMDTLYSELQVLGLRN